MRGRGALVVKAADVPRCLCCRELHGVTLKANEAALMRRGLHRLRLMLIELSIVRL